ncbi:hypothetical protein [Paraburkholderia sp. GAS32]
MARLFGRSASTVLRELARHCASSISWLRCARVRRGQ